MLPDPAVYTAQIGPPTREEFAAYEEVSFGLGQLDARLATVAADVAAAWQARGAVAAVAQMQWAAQAPVAPLALYATLARLPVADLAVPGAARSDRSSLPSWQALAPRLILLRRFAGELALGGYSGGRRPLEAWLERPIPALDHGPAPLRLTRALDQWRCAVLAGPEAVGALALPFALADQRVTRVPMAWLAIAERGLGAGSDRRQLRRRLLAKLKAALTEGLALLERLDGDHQRMLQRCAGQRKPANLRRLAAVMLECPLLSPALVARRLDMQLDDASALLRRAMGIGLVGRMTDRQSWTVYRALLVQDGYGMGAAVEPGAAIHPPIAAAPAPRGCRSLTDAVDAVLAEIDATYPFLTAADADPVDPDGD